MRLSTGLNPRNHGKLDNYGQEPWKLPLPAFIEQLYRKRFGKGHPDVVFPLNNASASTNRRTTLSCSVQAAAEAGSWRKTMRWRSGRAAEA